ncbi:MAG: von Willebrand factor type A domain-containing protein [Planctomycetota bacterium]
MRTVISFSLLVVLLAGCMSISLKSSGVDRAPIGDEEFSWAPVSGFVSAQDHPLSTYGIDVDTAAYGHVRRYLEQGRMPPLNAVRIEEMINAFDYGDPRPREGSLAVHTEVASSPWASMHRLVRIAVTGRVVDRAQRPDANLVFLIDVSGSMDRANKLPLVKQSMLVLLDELEARDSVAIVTYRDEAEVVLPPTSIGSRRRIERAIRGLEADGATNGTAGLDEAYEQADIAYVRNGINRVILATDGDFNRGRTDAGSLELFIRRKAQRGIDLTCLGVGDGNLKDSNLEALANAGNGHYDYLRDRADARRVLMERLESTLMVVARDVKVQVEFNPARVAAYRLIGYENRTLAAEGFANETVDGGELGAGQASVALYEIVPAGLGHALPGVEKLRYRENEAPSGSPELLTVKVRYRDTDPRRVEHPVVDGGAAYANASDDFRFTAGVAAFGMLLRDDGHRGAATYGMAEELVGRRDPELLTLMRAAARLDDAPRR